MAKGMKGNGLGSDKSSGIEPPSTKDAATSMGKMLGNSDRGGVGVAPTPRTLGPRSA